MSPKPFASSSFTEYEHYANDTIPFFRGGPPPLQHIPGSSINTVLMKSSESDPKTARPIPASNKKAATKSTKKETGQPVRRKPKSPISFPWSSRHSSARVPQQSNKTSARSPISKVSPPDRDCEEHKPTNTLPKRVDDSPFGPGSKLPATVETSFTIKEDVYRPVKQQPSSTSRTLTSPKRARRASEAVISGSTSIQSTPQVIAKHRSYSLAEGRKLSPHVKWGSPEFPFIKPQRLQKARTNFYAAPMEGQLATIKDSSDRFHPVSTLSFLSSPTRPRLGLGQNDGSSGSGKSARKQRGPLQSINSSLVHTDMPIRKPIQTSTVSTSVAPCSAALSLEQKFVSLKPQRDPPTPTSPSPSPPKKSKANAKNGVKAAQLVTDPGKAVLPVTHSGVLSLLSTSTFATNIDFTENKELREFKNTLQPDEPGSRAELEGGPSSGREIGPACPAPLLLGRLCVRELISGLYLMIYDLELEARGRASWLVQTWTRIWLSEDFGAPHGEP